MSLAFSKEALSWTEKTHENLSRYAAEESELPNYLLYTLGFEFEGGLDEELTWNQTKTIKDWLAYGANLEDKSDWGFPILPGTTTRSFNHFHNPLKVWEEAGLDDVYIFHFTGESSLLWAQDGNNQQSFPDGDWSWKKVREYFYIALTGRDFTGTEVASDKATRHAYFARTFRGLGQQMHLIQDLAQPDHVRNDAHPEDTLGLSMSIGFEKWAGKKFFELTDLKAFAPNPDAYFPQVSLNVSYNNRVPITQLIDTHPNSGTTPSIGVDQGIAEYTNGNFASDDTIFTEDLPSSDGHSFPYPRKTSTNLPNLVSQDLLPVPIIAEDGIEDATIYIKKERDGEEINHFLKPYYFTRQLIDTIDETHRQYHRWFYRDEQCHKDYAEKLIPRAVGYSAGLLDYFFRGRLGSANGHVYGGSVDMRVCNDTPDETMETGTLVFVWEGPWPSNDLLYASDEVKLIEPIPSGECSNTIYFFNLPEFGQGITLLIFRGRLGSEDDAVAVGWIGFD